MVRKKRSHYVRDWRGQFARVASHRTSINTKELRASTSKRRKDVADAAQKQREDSKRREQERASVRARGITPNAMKRNGNEVDTTPQTGVPEGKVSSSQYGMNYNEENEDVVERGRSVPDGIWGGLPVETLKHGTPLNANEEFLKQKSIDKVVNGNEEFREGYITKLWREPNGDLHIVDGHHRVAMYNALGKDMPVRIMDDKLHKSLVEPRDDVFVPERFKADERFAPLMQAYDKVKAKYGISRIDVTDDGVINDVAVVSYEHEFNTPETLNPELNPKDHEGARNRAQDLFWRAVGAAPEVRATIRNTVSRNNGSMGREYFDGQPTAVKTEHSLFRKVQAEMLEAGHRDPDKIDLKDSVRFTSVFGENDYLNGVASLSKDLEALGYTQIKGKEPRWNSADYRGLNMAFRREDGLMFELQVHTPRSLEIAEINHEYLNFSRMDTDAQLQQAMDSGKLKAKTGIDPKNLTVQQVRQTLKDIMNANVESIPVPRGVIMAVNGKDMVVNETAHFRVTGEAVKTPTGTKRLDDE